MTKQPYLPTWATAQEAAEWLQAETGEPWPLPRLIESGLVPHIWLAPEGQPAAGTLAGVFDGRHEGFLAPLVFAGDTQRLSVDRTGALSMTRSPSGNLVRFTPPVQFDIGAIRFKGADLRANAVATERGAPVLAPAAEPPLGAAPPLEDWKMRVQAARVDTMPAQRHVLQRRGDALAAVLTMAEKQALDADSWQSVWASLVALAQSAKRPPPLLGYSEGEGVKYQTDDAERPVGWLTREAYRGRFRRQP